MQTYNPTKPFNAETRSRIKDTWKAATAWNISIKNSGKRVSLQKNIKMFPWNQLPLEMDATDGVGTKGLLHWIGKSYANAAQDAFAMVADDLIEQGFVIYKLQDHIIVENDAKNSGERAIQGIIDGLVNVAKQHDVIISGGETAILDTLEGLEVGITGTGVKLYPAPMPLKEGDILIGLRSSGVHSNGITFLRRLYSDRLSKNAPDKKLLSKLTIPTAIYMKDLSALLKEFSNLVGPMLHITGGGWFKIREIDSEKKFNIRVKGVEASDSLFMDIYSDSSNASNGLTPSEMYERFNCGIGFMLAIHPSILEETLKILKQHNPVILSESIEEAQRGKGSITITDMQFEPGQNIHIK
jgi:phosphoribosylformylglycinamidine cyclo-ligase